MSEQKDHRTIILVGMMGAGKSTIGRPLAEKLGKTFVDLDRELEFRSGVSIPEIFEKEGEAGFRKRESRLLEEFTGSKDLVVATGGGVVISEENRRLLNASSSVVIYLKVSPEECFRRTANSDRPLLKCENPMKKITGLITVRTPYYEEVSQLSIETDGLTPAEAAERLVRIISRGKK